MKKIVLGISLVLFMSVSAYAMYGVLQGQDNNGMNTVCYYSMVKQLLSVQVKYVLYLSIKQRAV